MSEKSNEKIIHLKWFGLPQIWDLVKAHKKMMLAVLIAMGLSSVIDVILPLFQNYAINHYIGEQTLDTLPAMVILYVVVLLLYGLVNSIGIYYAFKAEVVVDRDIRQKCFDHVQTLSFSYFNQNSTGYIHSRVISDPNKIGMIISWGLMDASITIVYLIGIFIIMFSLNPVLGGLLLIVLPLEILATVYFSRHITRENRAVREMNSVITGDFNEGITGAKTIKSLVIEDRMQRDFEHDTSSMRAASVRAGRYRALFRAVIVFFSSIALALVLWRGGILNTRGLLLLGNMAVFMNYATSMNDYVQDLVNVISELIQTQVNVERINTLLHTESDVSDTPEVIEKYGDTFSPKRENWEPLHGDIEFKDVTFCYPDGEENVLEHFNLKVPQGSMVAIVGETGAGKSTLANLVCRFYEPTEGQVLIDGRDARERSQLWLHSHIGYVLQTPHLFSGTILDNLRYGNPDADMEEIETAVRRVHADGIIANMEHGYETQVGEGGDLLSTGEKQLLSFARALLANPQILILDEATSSVDTLTEKAIQEAIVTVTKGRTSFMIAHRLSTVRDADVILVMRDGKIVEQGTHEELLAAQGYYYRLHRQQFVEDAVTAH
ncbi:MAG: ABC transporter ATP-binding protein/permease, partial [Clostridiales bacterium]|nr:ABC transporter ATP-binding protein/permease [Clostridiales bacterium]